ncbi:uncharacterized protein LOC141685005 [Apium graveolens]|uniref:uncharacterized protein LOC141685005 n=1 Tax=Apium graveolens TaxID=4045 RepID=UPI003D7B9EC9
MAQELFRGYGRATGIPKCSIKIDLRKAFDSIDWSFIMAVLAKYNFPINFISWIEACITTTFYSVKINGALSGFFKGAKGLRQVVLAPNAHKSSVFFSNCKEDVVCWFDDAFRIPHGCLPISFLGVPLISSKLCIDDCLPLIDKLTTRMNLWTTLFLSLAGRVQLIRAVLCSIEAYWTNHFILLRAVHKHMQQLMTRFLWKGDPSKVGGAKVCWSDICLPKDEGGLGIRNPEELELFPITPTLV